MYLPHSDVDVKSLAFVEHIVLLQRDQISHQEKMVGHFEHELLEHRKDPPEKGARSRLIQEYCKKENYFKAEVL